VRGKGAALRFLGREQFEGIRKEASNEPPGFLERPIETPIGLDYRKNAGGKLPEVEEGR
jgi:hypothetical protein